MKQLADPWEKLICRQEIDDPQVSLFVSISPDALRIFQDKSDYFDLLVTDMTMPEMTGEQLCLEEKKIRPGMKTIICTGFSNRMNSELARDSGIDGFLYKPYVTADMAKLVRAVLDDG